MKIIKAAKQDKSHQKNSNLVLPDEACPPIFTEVRLLSKSPVPTIFIENVVVPPAICSPVQSKTHQIHHYFLNRGFDGTLTQDLIWKGAF